MANPKMNGHHRPQALPEPRLDGGSGRLSQLDGKAPESADFANYFCTYGYLYHQVQNLSCAVLHLGPGIAACQYCISIRCV